MTKPQGKSESELRILLSRHLGEFGLRRVADRGVGMLDVNTFQFEHRFHGRRKWRFDVAIWSGSTPEEECTAPGWRRRVAIEIDGGAWSGGRHVRGKGFIEDMSKRNEAQLLGWTVLHFTPQQILNGEYLHTVKRAITGW